MTIFRGKIIGPKPAKNFGPQQIRNPRLDQKFENLKQENRLRSSFPCYKFLSPRNVALIGSEREPMSIKNLLRLKYEMVLEMTL